MTPSIFISSRFAIVAVFLMTASIQGFHGAASQSDGFMNLFNGQNLTNWSGDFRFWSVSNGSIVGETQTPNSFNTFLIYSGRDFENFELQLQYRISSGNSGIQYRSRITNEATFSVGGFQADLEAGTDYTGILYELDGRGFLAMRGENISISREGTKSISSVGFTSAELQASILPLQWNNYTVLANGRRVKHIVNGKVFSECLDMTPNLPLSGKIALQLHDGMIMRVEFRDIQLRTLPASAAPHISARTSFLSCSLILTSLLAIIAIVT